MPVKTLQVDFSQRELFVSLFGNRVFLVGGTVRDVLVNGGFGSGKDIDLLVADTGYEEIEARLAGYGKCNTVGKSFAVVKFTRAGETFDISVPRRDRRIDPHSFSHHNFTVESGAHVTLDEDLARRDFTCNSIALRLSDGRLFDPFKGARAIARRRIIMTNPRSFADDPLRILRAARFAAKLEFAMEPGIYEQAKDVSLSELSAERVAEELVRLLLEARSPGRGLREYLRLGVLGKLFPELLALALTIQDARFHPEKDDQGHHTVWAHTLLTVDIAARVACTFGLTEERRLALLLAALLHDVAKPLTTGWEFKHGRMTITSPFHDSKGVPMTAALLERLRLETRCGYPLKETILNLVQYHHRIWELYRNREAISYKTIARAVKDMAGEEQLLLLLDFADRRSREKAALEFSDLDEPAKWFIARQEEYRITLETIAPLIQGRDLLALGFAPGRQLGGYLKKLYELQLDGEFSTREAGLALFIAGLKKTT